MASFACLLLCPPISLTSGTLDIPNSRTHPKRPREALTNPMEAL